MKSLPAFFLLFTVSTAAVAAPAEVPAVQTYDQLVHAIREVRSASQTRIEQAVDREKVREAWETGKLIDTHVLQHKERADYGKQVLERLAKDLEASRSELYYMLEFARTYPIVPAPGQLSWAHYKELLSINDDTQRREVAKQAEKENWSQKRTREEIRKRRSKESPQPKSPPLEAAPGKPGTYRVVKAAAGEYKGRLVIDLGFSNYYLPALPLDKLKDRDLVTLTGVTATGGVEEYEMKQYRLPKKSKPEDVLFTYKADVFQVIDGDTFDAVIDLGFGFNTVQKLRLRGLDAPELVSAEGKEAREWMVKQFAKAGNHILIKTVKSDKYDRYLADVFIPASHSVRESMSSPRKRGSMDSDFIYLNQKLIEEGLAVAVRD